MLLPAFGLKVLQTRMERPPRKSATSQASEPQPPVQKKGPVGQADPALCTRHLRACLTSGWYEILTGRPAT
jgi:hypothetical protein